MNSSNIQPALGASKTVSVSDLSGLLLNFYAAAAKGAKFEMWDMVVAAIFPDGSQKMVNEPWSDGDAYFSPSTLDAQAESLAFEARIATRALSDGRYAAYVVEPGHEDEWRDEVVGESRNIAITRCFIATRFGLEFHEDMGVIWIEDAVQPKTACAL